MVLSGWPCGRAAAIPVRTPASRSPRAASSSSAWSPSRWACWPSSSTLATKLYVWRLYLTMEPWSPMSWGAWILLLVYPVLAAGVLLDPPQALLHRLPALRPLVAWMLANPLLRRWVGFVSIVTGVALGIYTASCSRPSGRGPCGRARSWAALPRLGSLDERGLRALGLARARERVQLAWLDNLFLSIELGMIALFLIGLLSSTEAHADAAHLLLGGPYTAVFWWASSCSASCCRSRFSRWPSPIASPTRRSRPFW